MPASAPRSTGCSIRKHAHASSTEPKKRQDQPSEVARLSADYANPPDDNRFRGIAGIGAKPCCRGAKKGGTERAARSGHPLRIGMRRPFLARPSLLEADVHFSAVDADQLAAA